MEVLFVTFRPDGKQICGCGLNGNLYFIKTETGIEEAIIEGRRDIVGGRKVSDRRAAKFDNSVNCFSSASYSADDGECVIAGGRSKFVCLYHIETKMLLKKFQISCNLSLDGIREKLISRDLLHSGAKQEMEVSDSDSEVGDFEQKFGWNLKGGDITKRTTLRELKVSSVEFSPTNEEFIVSSTEGVLVYALNNKIGLDLDPFSVSYESTLEAVLKNVEKLNFSKALLISLSLGENEITKQVLEMTPMEEIKASVVSLRESSLLVLLSIIGEKLESSERVEFYLRWMKECLSFNGEKIREKPKVYVPHVRRLQKAVLEIKKNLGPLSDFNSYKLSVIKAK